ncbi:unnamed protein product, partial [Rotaria sordida]
MSDYQNQLEEKKRHLRNRWTSRIEETITKFVQDYKIILYQIPIEKEIIHIEYDFFDRLSELEFYNENSNVYQKQLFQYLTQKKFDMEKSKLELALLKQRITHNHLPTSFDKLEISIPTPIHTIMDTETAQSLKGRYDKILQRTKVDMMQVYVEAAEFRANQYRLQFNNAMNKLKENESTHLSDRILTKVIRPLYLTQSSSKLFHMLSKRLNYSLKKQHEQKFIYIRLNLFDQQYYLEIEQHLWQSYLDIGLQEQIWPDELYKMVKTTNDTKLCHDFLVNYLENLKKQINQCELQLNEQCQSCPLTSLTLAQIDHCLKEYVRSERSYLSIRNNDQLIKFKDYIHEKDVFKTINTFQLSINLNEYLNKLITIREQQSEIWKDYLMLKMRILCKFLPQNFDHLENFIEHINYLPLNN